MRMKRVFWAMGVFLILFHVGHAEEADPTLRNRRATVKIMTTHIRPDYYTPWEMKRHTSSSGSGAIVPGNLILTNAHVVSDAAFIEVQKENDPNKYEAQLSFIGHECDLALLKVKDAKFFASTTALEIGDALPKMKSIVATYGFPIGGEHVSITEGVVSRIEVRSYVHSYQSAFITIQTDAAINPGNSGGPVIQADRIIGVAFQSTRGAENIGYMVPVPIIRHFVTDIADGRFDGFPDLGIYTDELENKGYREYLGMSDDQSGILVTRVLPGSSSVGQLKEGDVLLRVDGVPIANDASVPFEFGRIQYSHLIDMKQIGDTVELTVWRDKKEATLKFPVRQPPIRIPWFREFETLPRYYIFAGVVFQPLTREYLETMPDWYHTADLRVLYYYLYAEKDRCCPEHKEFILLTRVLPDSVNTYISDAANKVVARINGAPITRLEDVIEAFKKPSGKYHVIEIEGNFKPLMLDAARTREANDRILKNFGIPSDRRLVEHPVEARK